MTEKINFDELLELEEMQKSNIETSRNKLAEKSAKIGIAILKNGVTRFAVRQLGAYVFGQAHKYLIEKLKK